MFEIVWKSLSIQHTTNQFIPRARPAWLFLMFLSLGRKQVFDVNSARNANRRFADLFLKARALACLAHHGDKTTPISKFLHQISKILRNTETSLDLTRCFTSPTLFSSLLDWASLLQSQENMVMGADTMGRSAGQSTMTCMRTSTRRGRRRSA